MKKQCIQEIFEFVILPSITDLRDVYHNEPESKGFATSFGAHFNTLPFLIQLGNSIGFPCTPFARTESTTRT